jgi:hypothetical protein
MRHRYENLPAQHGYRRSPPLQDADDVEQHGPSFYWGRGFIVGALLSAATLVDMLGFGWTAFRL